MKLGLFGGTFDPIHNGHLSMAAAFADELGLDQVVFIPAGSPTTKALPRARLPSSAWPWWRRRLRVTCVLLPATLTWCAKVQLIPWILCKFLRQYYPNAEMWWLMGMDSLLSLHTWHRYQDIFKLANVAVAARNDEKIQQVAPEMRALVAQGLSQATSASKGQLRLLQWQPEDISSTQIRNAVKSGLAI